MSGGRGARCPLLLERLLSSSNAKRVADGVAAATHSHSFFERVCVCSVRWYLLLTVCMHTATLQACAAAAD